MKTLALRDGDLVLSGDRYAMVEGAARVQQALSLCLHERIGIDRFHPGWGSRLPGWIGTQIRKSSIGDVEMEVSRVVRSHIRSQAAFVRRLTAEGRTPPISADEMVSGIASIQTSQDLDTITARVVLSTMGRTEFAVLTSPEG